MKNHSDILKDLFLLDRNIVFLNHGSFGACPKPVFDVFQSWQRKLELQPVIFLDRGYDDLMAEARKPLGKYLNVDPENLVYVPNATTGVNIAVRSIPLSPGDEVITTNHEYGAMDRTWRYYCQKQGAAYVNVELPYPIESAEQIVEAVWSCVTPRTKVLFLSHITSPTAVIMPIEPLIQRAREAGIFTIIDGAHAPGQIPLDLSAINADFYTGNFHKWLCAPKGAGFLYVSPAVQELLEPMIVSWGWEPRDPRKKPLLNLYEWQGTNDPSAWLTVPAAIEFQEKYDWDQVRSSCHQILKEFRSAVSALTGKPCLIPDSTDFYMQLASFELPVSNAVEMKTRLYDDFQIEIPVLEWENRTLIRVSVQGYNSRKDTEYLLDTLKKILHEESI